MGFVPGRWLPELLAWVGVSRLRCPLSGQPVPSDHEKGSVSAESYLLLPVPLTMRPPIEPRVENPQPH